MKSTKCVQCGFVGWSDLENCKACGAPLNLSPGNFPPTGAYHASGYQTEGQQKGLAIAGMVLGIVSVVCLGLFVVSGIIGLVLSAMAMGRAKSEPWRYGGRGMAVAGLVMSITSLCVAPVGIVLAIAIPNLLASYRAANEGSAQSSMRTITQAQLTYQSTVAKYATLQELADRGLIAPELGSGIKNGYRFTVTIDSENPEHFELTGVPVTYGKTGVRSFYIDETFVMRAADNFGGPPTAMDDPVGSDDEFQTRSSRRRVEYRPLPAN